MKTVLITGAAGGVGLALAKSFAAQGYHLVLTDRDTDALAQTAGQFSAEIEQITADLRSSTDLEALTLRLESTEHPIDVLVNNAGIIVPGAVGAINDDLMRAHVDINMTAPMVLCSAAARAMKQRRTGHIFSIMSIAAIGPMKTARPTLHPSLACAVSWHLCRLNCTPLGLASVACSQAQLTLRCWPQKWPVRMALR